MQAQSPYGATPQFTVTTHAPAGGFTPTNAMLALILACLSFVACGIFMSIPAVIIAGGALQITNSQPGHPDASNANAARILAWINIGIQIVGLIGFAFFLVLGVLASAAGSV